MNRIVVTFDNYQELAHKYANYENDVYPALGYVEEVGEAVGKIAKSYRGDKALDLEELKLEIGDAFWMMSEVAMQESIELDFFILLGKQLETVYTEKDMLDCLIKQSDDSLLSMLCYYELNLLEILQMNIDKLESRWVRGTLQGEGDHR